MHNKLTIRRIIESGLPVLILVSLLFCNYTFFFRVPFLGFDFNPTDGKVINVWVEQPAFQSLQPGDRLLQVGSLEWATLSSDNRQSLLENAQLGDLVELRVQRNNREITIPWRLFGPNPVELIARLSVTWLWFIFWLAGTATILLVRPRSTRWILLIAFFYMMAAWLMVGWMSNMGVWYSRILLRVFAWLTLPVFLHLSWVFPRPLGRLPAGLLWATYLCSGILAGLEFFRLLPQLAYVIGVLLALAVSAFLLILHAILQPDVRGDLKVLSAAILLALFSGFLLGSQAITQADLQFWIVWSALLSISAIPGAYFYVIYRRQLGGFELKANRIISFYLFSVVLITFAIFAVWFITIKSADHVPEVGIEIAGLLFIGLVTALTYPSFQRLIERRLLGIPIAPAQLIEAYAAKITTSLDSESLVILLRDEILPSLLVRQSTLLRIGEENSIESLYQTGISESALPAKTDIQNLVERSGRYRPPDANDGLPDTLRWVQLIIPLDFGGKLIGIWLLGRRDPDDFYAQTEISVLQTIANQTAIALINIAHAELLHALYQADIERQEKERAALARGLHDEVLNQLAVLFIRQPTPGGISLFDGSEELISDYLRDVISELRPTMLNYGLKPAINELVDHLSERINESPTFEINLDSNEIRYDPNIEQYMFRIVQQACENAIRHSNAQLIRITGNLKSESIHLLVEDDGLGFQIPGSLDLEGLLKQKHYGLVGMYERALVINADLTIHSEPGKGTRVEIVWSDSNNDPTNHIPNNF